VIGHGGDAAKWVQGETSQHKTTDTPAIMGEMVTWRRRMVVEVRRRLLLFMTVIFNQRKPEILLPKRLQRMSIKGRLSISEAVRICNQMR
jgi:hypothetical protein